ncbi:NAD-dependent epimerase/dehydratase family protein [Umezawaea endophytica]|uniref:NAD(P)H-binding protein n=1 Tax=Umezawaea endophytica TaxID=1654476 RepID=A0A9X2VS44_9PSEU|nr:NAD(P)H-binding protein [Umezawaea endophytica]MCS7481631.1 NAD(P)H-binding protein [Umezawaea endophytica]
MRVLVVGASGLVGQHVVERLRDRRHEVTAVARTARPGIDRAFDATAVTEADLAGLLAGHDGVVFAAGRDDRQIPRKPSYPAFHQGNVEPVVKLLAAARKAGATSAVVLGSYYTHFDRLHPEWELAVTHPYVRSRVEQARAGREAAGPNLPVAVLELPFVFGRADGRLPNWSGGLDRWVRSRSPLFAPPGGSAATTATSVADAAVLALEERSGEDVPLVDENLTWKDLISRVATAAGHAREVHDLPAGVLRAAMHLTGLAQTLTGKQSGMNPAGLGDLMLRDLFVRHETPRAIDHAIRETFPARA